MAILIDSNVLIYMVDGSDAPRRQRAIEVVTALWAAGEGRLSAQCLSEFFHQTSRGKMPMLALRDAEQQVDYLARSFETYPVTQQVVMEAIRGVREHQFSFWDAQIWAAARLNQVPVVFSENFHVGSVCEGVRFVDPFGEDFNLAHWVSGL